MKYTILSTWALGLGLILAGCQIPVGVHSGKGHVILGASSPTAAKAASRSLHATHPSRAALAAYKAHSRSLLTRSRELSASQDIDTMSYTVTDLSGFEPDQSDFIDPTYPYVDLFLTPGNTYKVTISVTPTSSASRPKVGVTKFGDQQTFTVDPYGGDTYVDLFLHPVGTPALAPNGASSISAYTKTASPAFVSTASFSVTWSTNAGNRLAYGSEGRLYYLDAGSAKVYEITDYTSASGVRTAIDGASFNDSFKAICPDPIASGLIWAVGKTGANWHIWSFVVPEGGTATVQDDYDLGSDPFNPDSVAGDKGTEVATGIAVDLLGDIYLSYVNTDTAAGTLHSGIEAYYYSTTPYQPSDHAPGTWTSADSVITDVQFAEGKVFVLGAPSTGGYVTAEANTGRSTVWAVNDFLDTVWQSSISTDWTTNSPGGAATFSYKPVRFQGLIESGLIPMSIGDYGASVSSYPVWLSTDDTDTSIGQPLT